MGRWEVISRQGDITTWECPHCKETYSSKRKRGNLDLVPDEIKESRKKYAKDILQPHREGYASREYIEAYPDRAKDIFTDKERRTAKNVWKDVV